VGSDVHVEEFLHTAERTVRHRRRVRRNVVPASYDSRVMTFNIPITVVRSREGGEKRLPMHAIDGTTAYYLPVDADIQEGDRVEQVLPNGRTRTVYVTKVDVLQSPFGNDLDHTEAHYTTNAPATTAAPGATTFNVTATNVQVATGTNAHQSMTVGATTEHLVELIKGISELTALAGIVDGSHDELVAARDEAIAAVDGSNPDAGAVRRFAEWVMARAKAGTNSAVSAAIGAAVSALIQDVEALTRALGH